MVIRVAFLGSADFSVPVLRKVASDSDFEIVGVFTTEPKKQNRGQKVMRNIVVEVGTGLGYGDRIIETARLSKDVLFENEVFTSMMEDGFLCDVMIVAAYANLIPEWFLKLARFDVINLHPSALPRWRGAAPIERAIEAGDSEIDICVMRVAKELDAGEVYKRRRFDVSKKHASEVFEEVSKIGGEMIVKTAKEIFNRSAIAIPQCDSGLAYARKIDKAELRIDFDDRVVDAYNKIRAFNNSGCWFMMNSLRVKILEVECFERCETEFRGFDKLGGKLFFSDGWILPKVAQKEGKNRMALWQFLAGVR